MRSLKNLHHLAFIGNPIANSSVNGKSATTDENIDGMKNDRDENDSFYTISILDAANSLKSLDHLSVAPSMYRNLALMKNQLEAQDFVQEVSSFYAHEMASLAGIQRNLLQRHQFEQFTLEKAVKSRTVLLREEMNDFIHYSQTKITKGLAQIQIALLSAEISTDIINNNEKNDEDKHVDNKDDNNKIIDKHTYDLEILQKNVFESQAYLNDLKLQFDALKRRKKREQLAKEL